MTTILTNADAEQFTGIKVPEQLEREAEVPVYRTDVPNRQGDVYTYPPVVNTQNCAGEFVGDVEQIFDAGISPDTTRSPLTRKGVKVVEGEADRNSHILQADGPKSWFARCEPTTPFDYGVLEVAPDEMVLLTHTGEHYAALIPEGLWLLRGQKDAATMRRVAD